MNEAETEERAQAILVFIARPRWRATIQEIASALSISEGEAQSATTKLEEQKRLVRWTGLTPDDRAVTFGLPNH